MKSRNWQKVKPSDLVPENSITDLCFSLSIHSSFNHLDQIQMSLLQLLQIDQNVRITVNANEQFVYERSRENV